MWTAETILACALALMPRRADLLPPIVLVEVRPAEASAGVEGWVLANDRRIHLLTTSAAFQRVMHTADRCGDLTALKKIASVIAHEEWHVRYGPDEAAAYDAQLTMLTAMHAGFGTPLYVEVLRARVAIVSPRPARRSAAPRRQASYADR